MVNIGALDNPGGGSSSGDLTGLGKGGGSSARPASASASVASPKSAGGSPAAVASGGLTALGRHLATLPVDVRVGKMLIYAAMLGCLDPVRSNDEELLPLICYIASFNSHIRYSER